jgi:hypothetical protein
MYKVQNKDISNITPRPKAFTELVKIFIDDNTILNTNWIYRIQYTQVRRTTWMYSIKE